MSYSADLKLVTGQRVVTAAGTPEALIETPANVKEARVKLVIIRAHTGNGGDIYVGANNSVASTTGYILTAGETVELDVSDEEYDVRLDLTQIWIDADNNGEGVSYLALREM